MPFQYRDGRLVLKNSDLKNADGGHDLLQLARSQEHAFYVYALDDVVDRIHRLQEALKPVPSSIHYAMKANANPMLLRRMVQEDVGVDTVSGGEVEEALNAGFKPEQIIFSGVGKSRQEIELAIHLGIKQINIESPQELERVAALAKKAGKQVDVAFRMNPDVNPNTHPYITTGFRENKFGMDESFLPELREILQREKNHVRIRGLTLHIGSQLMELDALRDAITKTIPIFVQLRDEYPAMNRFDIGGGLGIDYTTADTKGEFALIEDYGKMVVELLQPLGCEVLAEPGRILVARAGLLIGEVQYIKKTVHKTFAILNTGMNHLLRPALYQARHRVLPVEHRAVSPLQNYDVVGPICESSDFLAKDVRLPELRPGDFLAIADAGAYGFSMASHYNKHALPAEVILSNDASSVPD